MSKNQYDNPDNNNNNLNWAEKLREYHYNAYKNLIKASLFLNAAGITAVMASFALKSNSQDYKAMGFRLVEKHCSNIADYYQALNHSLDLFLLSIFFIIVCVSVEYFSYLPRRAHEDYVLTKDIPCSFCKSFISISQVIMYITLIAAISILIFAAISFKNVPAAFY